MMRKKRGFILLIVLSSIAIAILSATTLISIGTNEMRQAKKDTDHMNAYYGAVSGAERLYALLTSQLNDDIDWTLQTSSGTLTAGASTLTTYRAAAYPITYNNATKKGQLGILSTGVSGSATSRVTVKYGYTATSTGPAPIASAGNIVLTGHIDKKDKKNPKSSSIYVEGPLQTAGTVSITAPADLVTINGGYENNVLGISPLSFWRQAKFDTVGNGTAFSDTDGLDKDANGLDIAGTEKVTEAQAKAQAAVHAADHPDMLTHFYENDVNDDLVINDKDAFIYYYTVHLDQSENLNIAPGEASYFSPVTTPTRFENHIDAHGKAVKLLGVESSSEIKHGEVQKSTEAIFVDGDLYIDKTDLKWKGGAFTHTIICTGSVGIKQPTNEKDDTLAIVALGDVTLAGKDSGKSQLNGNLIVYTKGDFTAYLGGTSHNAIFAEGVVTIDTWKADKNSDRTMYNLLGSWTPPIGLPPGYRTIVYDFKMDPSAYPTEWEMTSN